MAFSANLDLHLEVCRSFLSSWKSHKHFCELPSKFIASQYVTLLRKHQVISKPKKKYFEPDCTGRIFSPSRNMAAGLVAICFRNRRNKRTHQTVRNRAKAAHFMLTTHFALRGTQWNLHQHCWLISHFVRHIIVWPVAVRYNQGRDITRQLDAGGGTPLCSSYSCSFTQRGTPCVVPVGP